jgi:hypothetical protein
VIDILQILKLFKSAWGPAFPFKCCLTLKMEREKMSRMNLGKEGTTSLQVVKPYVVRVVVPQVDAALCRTRYGNHH